jgi:four helix bundle protein
MPKKLSELEVYILSEELSNHIWKVVKQWNYFEKMTIGNQLVRAADSISANIAECHGRYHYKDKQKFGYYTRGSFEETKSWLRKCHNRNLIRNDQLMIAKSYLKKIGPKLNSFINRFRNPPI